MRRISIVFRREFSGYFATPLAAIFLVVFLFLASMFAFNIGGFFDRGQADLRPFFQFHPWLYLFLVPAISMRLWAEERRTGTIELIATLPLTMQDLVLGKFFAAWAFSGLALLLTVPMWWTVSFLGEPDHGVIVCSYLASWLTAGAFLAIGSAISSLTKNQVVAFVLCAATCFLLLLSATLCHGSTSRRSQAFVRSRAASQQLASCLIATPQQPASLAAACNGNNLQATSQQLTAL